MIPEGPETFRVFLAGDERSSPTAVFIDFGIRLCENPRQNGIESSCRLLLLAQE
jgi:hypothetical protein